MKLVIFKSFGGVVITGLVLYIGAGTFFWPSAWLYLSALAVGNAMIISFTGSVNTGLLLQRAKPVRPVKFFDLIVIQLQMTFVLLFLLISAFDACRFGPPAVPFIVRIFAGIILLLTFWVQSLAMCQNKFAINTIEIKTGQVVVQNGLYSIIRHPMYLSFVVYYLFSPLCLGSFVGLIPAFCAALCVMGRTWYEDRLLLTDLPGYSAYAAKVHWRLVPGIW